MRSRFRGRTDVIEEVHLTVCVCEGWVPFDSDDGSGVRFEMDCTGPSYSTTICGHTDEWG